jgi:hypothetical protein
MNSFLKSIQYVTGPLTLIAFLAVVALAVFRAWIKHKDGLKSLYDLLKIKLSQERFYELIDLIIRRSFILILVVWLASLASWVAAEIFKNSPPAPKGSAALEIVSAKYTEQSELDVLVRNPAEDAAVIHVIEVAVIKDEGDVLPVLPGVPRDQTRIPINDLKVGGTRKKPVTIDTSSHEGVNQGTVERPVIQASRVRAAPWN